MTSLPTPHVVVVGAGVGGLTCALELAARGLRVTMLERAATPGGKMRQVVVGGAAMDAGPTVFTMRWVFDALFDGLGTRLDEHLQLQPMTVLARHAWDGDQRLDLFANVQRSADAIGDFAGAAAARGYLDFCARAGDIYRTLERPFLRSSRPNPLSLTTRVGLRGLPGLLRISPLATLWQELGRHFSDPRLQQLFGRYATYCGSSPYLAPATLMLVAHVEQSGVWRVQGGMHRVAQVLAEMAQQRGAAVRCNAHVEQVLLEGGRACGVRLAGGETLKADAVVFNGDAAALGAGLLGDAVRHGVTRVPPHRRSLSAVTWNLHAQTSGFPLSHHTAFFSANYAAEFNDIRQGRLPAAPTVYVCAQDCDDNEIDTVNGNAARAERLLLIVNAPANGESDEPADNRRNGPSRAFNTEELAQCEDQTFRLLQRCGLQVDRSPQTTQRTTPQDFNRLFPATGGALYGQASHGWMASFTRPAARCKVPRLYLAGGSVHPGPGVPMAALSGRQAAASVLADLVDSARRKMPTQPAQPVHVPPPQPSTWPSHPADTPGGTSTR